MLQFFFLRSLSFLSLLTFSLSPPQQQYHHCTVRADVGVSGAGSFYYELSLQSAQQIVIGFANRHCGLAAGQHLGSDDNSWGFDGYQAQKFSSGINESFGSPNWKSGDVIGVLLNFDQRKISYSKNGKLMGVAFSQFPRNELMYPAVSLRRNQKVTFNFGSSKFKFSPKNAYPYHVILNATQKTAISKLFDHYRNLGNLLVKLHSISYLNIFNL